MRRGEIWLADVGREPRPVLVITRDDVLDVRTNVTVVEISTQARGLAVEVPIDTDQQPARRSRPDPARPCAPRADHRAAPRHVHR